MSEKVKKFRLFDAVLAAVCIVLVVESSAPAAAIGNSQFFWWIFLLIGFFLPYGLISAELGTTYEDEGGIYDWVRRAFGNRWGSRVAWYYYINYTLWIASLAVLFFDIIIQITGWEFSVITSIIIQLAFIWVVIFISNFPVSENKWLLNIAAFLKAFIMLSIGLLGIYRAITVGPANEFTLGSLIPTFDADGLSYISVIIFNFLGFEVVTTFASEMSDPKKEIPKAIILGGIIIALFYLLSAFGISVAIPTEELTISSGIIESVMLLTGQTEGIIITIFGIIFLYTLIANLTSWSFGVNYVAKYAADQKALPRVFSIEDKKGMPLGANIINGVIASAIVIIAPFIPSQDIFWSFFALNMVTLLMSYILMFPAFLKLRKTDPDAHRPFKINGSDLKLKIMSFVPMILLIISVIFSVVPLSRDPAELSEKIPLLIGTIVAIIIGEIIAAGAVKSKAEKGK